MAEKFTLDYVKNFIELESNSGCELLSKEYINAYQKLNIKCPCGEEFKTNFIKFKDRNKRQCNECGIKIGRSKRTYDFEGKPKLTHTEVKEFVEITSNSGCKLISEEYKGTNKPLLFECRCGKEFVTNFHNFRDRNKRLCFKCSQIVKGLHRRHTYDEVKQFIEIDSESGCELISTEYLGTNKKLEIKCHCGEHFIVSFHDFKDKPQRQCKKCSKSISRGELAIKEYFDKNKIKYKQQYKIKDCKDKTHLPFDFAVLNKDKSLRMLIEFQGQQHYIPIGYWGGEEGFKQQQYRDEIKRNYCISNNINLVIIPYSEFKNINIILEKELNKEVK